MKVEILETITKVFSSLPGIGKKTAERITFALLQKTPEEISKLGLEIENLNKIKRCKYCNSLSIEESCQICSDDSRSSETLCVVDDIRNIWLFEDNNIFKGKYFVLSNLINPIQGVDVDKLNLEQLNSIIKKFDIKELLLALKPSIEGETTALYISKLYKAKIKVTKLAQGVPLGAEIEYLDPITIEQAMKDRKEI